VLVIIRLGETGYKVMVAETKWI